MRKCKVFIEKSEYGYSAYIGDTPLEFGCIGEGKTVEETIEDFLGTFEAMKQDYIAAGNKFEDVDIEFCYDTASFLSEYAGIFSLSGLEKITGVSQAQLGQDRVYVGHHKYKTIFSFRASFLVPE